MPLRHTAVLELAILGLLSERDMHGYEIRRRLRDELGILSNVSYGSLYPALNRLEKSGALEVMPDPGSSGSPAHIPVPMTGSLSGERAALRSRISATTKQRRARKVYRITDYGRRLFVKLLDEEARGSGDDARLFGLRLAFARHLPPQSRIRLLERRRAHMAELLSKARSAASADLLDSYALSLVEHTAEVAEKDISWLDHLIDAERSAASSGPADQPSQQPHPRQSSEARSS